jgi:5-formyltetrahydrofolate cyclo-ligase
LTDKQTLRTELRQRRNAHEAAIPDSMRALLFMRPPGPLLDLVPNGATIAVYHPVGSEASPLGYARWFAEQGHVIALPWFAGRGEAMQFRRWDNPFDEDSLARAPYGGLQTGNKAELVHIGVAIVPLLGFTTEGQRLGQGGGHYDRYLAEHQNVIPIGIGWDCQLVEALPIEPHDRPLRAVVTPTRIYGPF